VILCVYAYTTLIVIDHASTYSMNSAHSEFLQLTLVAVVCNWRSNSESSGISVIMAQRCLVMLTMCPQLS